ncbi:serine hydrolase [Planctomycetaceae bacterium SH139]
MLSLRSLVFGVLLSLFCCCFLHSTLLAADPASDDLELAKKLSPMIAAHDGQVAVAVKHLSSGKQFLHRADAVMPTASLIKLPVMIEAYRQATAGQLNLDDLLTLEEADKVPGSGILTSHFSGGTRCSLRDAIRLMIVYSDNTATNLVIDKIGMQQTAETMTKLGYPETQLHSKVYRGSSSISPERSQKYGLGSTRCSDMLQLLESIDRKELISADACEAMLDHLLACDDRSKLARQLPSNVPFAHKTGALSAVRTDAGLIFSPAGSIAICVLTAQNADQSWGDENAAELLCGRIGRVVFDHFNPSATADSQADATRPLTQGDLGPLVEALQRTLNRQADAGLNVDGDFGPATLAAVKRFQEKKNLEVSGTVDILTWQALGPLVMTAEAVPTPAEINSQVLSRQPADTLAGPPIVGCQAWTIVDEETGQVLWSQEADRKLHPASTTKIMTAVVILQMCQENPSWLDERLTFSKRADATRGSTAGVGQGESLSVRDCLYGLLLPSGNDAAVALAEHFGEHLLASPEYSALPDISDPFDRFIAEMNRTASRLGLAETTYRNPHGMTDSEHLTTANELAQLTREARRYPLFRQLVATRQYGCQLLGAGGYTRNVMWENTNDLLPIEGFSGVKTGTTSAAGACLVASGESEQQALIVVVLKANSSRGRYVDARNLFRWAYSELLREK